MLQALYDPKSRRIPLFHPLDAPTRARDLLWTQSSPAIQTVVLNDFVSFLIASRRARVSILVPLGRPDAAYFALHASARAAAYKNSVRPH
jgi:hypothetical protein